MSESAGERRKYARLGTDQVISFAEIDRPDRLAVGKNLSTGGIRFEARRVYQQHALAQDLDLLGDAVSRNTGGVRHQRAPVAGESVEQPRLSDVGASD